MTAMASCTIRLSRTTSISAPTGARLVCTHTHTHTHTHDGVRIASVVMLETLGTINVPRIVPVYSDTVYTLRGAGPYLRDENSVPRLSEWVSLFTSLCHTHARVTHTHTHTHMLVSSSP